MNQQGQKQDVTNAEAGRTNTYQEGVGTKVMTIEGATTKATREDNATVVNAKEDGARTVDMNKKGAGEKIAMNYSRTENMKRERPVTENRTTKGVGTNNTMKEVYKGVGETLNGTDQLTKDSLFKVEIEKHRLRLYAGTYRHCFSQVESAPSLPSEKECTNPRVPNIVHLVWTYEKTYPFKFRQLLSVSSMLQIQKPCAVLFWYAGYMPTGNYWKQFQVGWI